MLNLKKLTRNVFSLQRQHVQARKRANTRQGQVASGEAKLLIPVIVLAELIFTIENKPIKADLDKILNAINSSPNIEFVDFDYESALKLRDLTEIPEMHDRMIVVSAILSNAVLITFDQTITEANVVEAIW